jgi:hypothetical protein
MKKFYIEYKGKPKVQPLVAQIPWSHNLIILDKTKNDYEKRNLLGVISVKVILVPFPSEKEGS